MRYQCLMYQELTVNADIIKGSAKDLMNILHIHRLILFLLFMAAILFDSHGGLDKLFYRPILLKFS